MSNPIGVSFCIGTVKFYDSHRKFGFIVVDDGREIFFNSNYFRGTPPAAAARVKFTLSRNERGCVAKGIEQIA